MSISCDPPIFIPIQEVWTDQTLPWVLQSGRYVDTIAGPVATGPLNYYPQTGQPTAGSSDVETTIPLGGCGANSSLICDESGCRVRVDDEYNAWYWSCRAAGLRVDASQTDNGYNGLVWDRITCFPECNSGCPFDDDIGSWITPDRFVRNLLSGLDPCTGQPLDVPYDIGCGSGYIAWTIYCSTEEPQCTQTILLRSIPPDGPPPPPDFCRAPGVLVTTPTGTVCKYDPFIPLPYPREFARKRDLLGVFGSFKQRNASAPRPTAPYRSLGPVGQVGFMGLPPGSAFKVDSAALNVAARLPLPNRIAPIGCGCGTSDDYEESLDGN